MGSLVSLLDREVYGMGQVDRLLGLGRGTAARWIDGYERRSTVYEPLVRPESTGSQIVTWGESRESIAEMWRLTPREIAEAVRWSDIA